MKVYEFKKFRLKFIDSVSQYFLDYIVHEDGDDLKISNGNVEVQITLSHIYNYYKAIQSYEKFLNPWIKNIEDMLQQHSYKIDYSKIYPLIRKKEHLGKEVQFYSKPISVLDDINICFGQDEGEMFRILTTKDVDSDTNYNKVYNSAIKNINAIENKLVPIHKTYKVYTLEKNSDVASSMVFFNKHTQEQIKEYLGDNFLIAISAASTLLVAENVKENVDLLKYLIKDEKDPNFVTDNIIEYRDGIYRYVDN